MSEPVPRHVRFGPYQLDRIARELRDGDNALLPLTGKAFDTLCCLIDNQDRVLGKDELIAAVWPGRVVEENNLTQAVSALRRVLGSDHRYIVTVPGRGYRFVADAEAGAAEPDPQAAPAPGLSGPAAPIARRLPAPSWWAALVVSVAIAGVIFWRDRAPPPMAQAAATPMQQTLAVLPFRSLSPGARDELLELGLAETLISRISGSTSLHVRSLSSSQRVAGTGKDPLEAGRQLNAAYVVEGTTQRNGNRVRVNARLLAVADGSALWSGTFDESIDRIFTLQDGIASAVSSALAVKFRTPVRGRSACQGDNAEAYRAYLAGRYQLDRPSAVRMRQALTEFRRAIELDPSCARAYAGMAFAYRALAMTGDADPREIFPLAQAAVSQALAIDPDSAEAHSSQGFIHFWYDWDWAGSEASLKRAIAINPSLGEAHMAYAHLLYNLGRKEESAQQARQAIALDPLSPLINTLSSGFLLKAGHTEEAKRALNKALELEPEFWIALLLRSDRSIEARDYASAITDLTRARDRCGDCSQVLAALGPAYVMAGERGLAEQVLRDLEKRAATGYMPATSLAAVRAALGDTGGALDLLERAYKERDVRLAFIAVDTRWTTLQPQPRFQALLQRMNLPDANSGNAQGKNQVNSTEPVRGGPK